MSHSLDIVGLCGSLRKASLNHAALRLAGESMPATMTLDIVDWRDVPVFDGDAFAQGLPGRVAALRERIRPRRWRAHRDAGIQLLGARRSEEPA